MATTCTSRHPLGPRDAPRLWGSTFMWRRWEDAPGHDEVGPTAASSSGEKMRLRKCIKDTQHTHVQNDTHTSHPLGHKTVWSLTLSDTGRYSLCLPPGLTYCCDFTTKGLERTPERQCVAHANCSWGVESHPGSGHTPDFPPLSTHWPLAQQTPLCVSICSQ